MPAPVGHEPYNKNGEGGRLKEWTLELIEIMADRFEVFMNRPDAIWYEDFCLEQGIHRIYYLNGQKQTKGLTECMLNLKFGKKQTS